MNFALDLFFPCRAFSLTDVRREFAACLPFFMLCDEDCLVLHGCHVERNFHFLSFYEFVPAAQNIQLSASCIVLLVFFASLGSGLTIK